MLILHCASLVKPDRTILTPKDGLRWRKLLVNLALALLILEHQTNNVKYVLFRFYFLWLFNMPCLCFMLCFRWKWSRLRNPCPNELKHAGCIRWRVRLRFHTTAQLDCAKRTTMDQNNCLKKTTVYPPHSPVLFLLSFFKKLFVCVMLRLAADSQTRCLGMALLWVMWLKGGDDPHLETGDSGCHGDYLVACTTVTQWPHHHRLRYCLWTLVRKPIKWRRNQCVLFKYSSP